MKAQVIAQNAGLWHVNIGGRKRRIRQHRQRRTSALTASLWPACHSQHRQSHSGSRRVASGAAFDSDAALSKYSHVYSAHYVENERLRHCRPMVWTVE